MAILLSEAGLYERCLIYATDLNERIIEQARAAIMPAALMREYSTNYQKAGGAHSLADYYTAHYGSVVLDEQLKRNIVFATHNLATDGVFGEMHVIVCRNVLIYFTRTLQHRALDILSGSLCHRGFLCLGSKETLAFAPCAADFDVLARGEKIYRRKAT